ncbi:MAG: 3-oxoacyl-ACP reductase FabG [Acidimicrobiia bacterium]
MPLKLATSRVLVTGGARGIGEAIARRLATEGAAVAILDLDADAAAATASQIAGTTGQVVGFGCDVSNRSQVAEVVPAAAESLGGLDGLITNAGVARDGFLHKLDDDAWDTVIAVHLTGTFACLRAASPWLRADGPGRVVCISSISAAMGNLGQSNYTAAKGGILSLVKTAALELARFQTTVNAIRPGFIDTAMTQAVPPDLRQKLIDDIPLGRSGEPGDVAGAVAFLCSEDASYMTGAVLDINGGAYM